MQIETSYVDVPVEGKPMRTFLAAPARSGCFPGIAFYTDIFQLTPSSLRWASRLASYGFVVAVPEIYHRIETAGTVLDFDDEGKARGQADVDALYAEQFDVDIASLLTWLAEHPRVGSGRLGVAGHCTGGHIAFRAALQDSVAATACWYATGLDNGKLGADADAGSLQRCNEIDGELLMIFGSRDPHTGAEGRDIIKAALEQASVTFEWDLYDAEHAFGRDVGPRWDPQITDEAFGRTIALFDRILRSDS